MELTYQVDPSKDLDLTKFSISDTEAYNRNGKAKRINGVKGVTMASDYLPILATKRQSAKEETTCRLIPMSLVAHGNPRDVTAKILLTTKSPRLSQAAGPPTLDILFQDHTKVRVGFQNIPRLEETSTTNEENNAWMATSIHFGEEKIPRYRIQMTRQNFHFLIQLFDTHSNTTCVSLLTYGAVKNQPRIIHGFRGNVTTSTKAKEQHISQLFAILDERDGLLAFQNALRQQEEKATLCVMLLLRTRIITVNYDAW